MYDLYNCIKFIVLVFIIAVLTWLVCRWHDDGAAVPPSAGPDIPLRPHRYDRPENLPRAHHPGRAAASENGHGEKGGDLQLCQQNQDALYSAAGACKVGV